MSLDEMRERIDHIDEDLLRLLNERVRIAVDIGHWKRQTGGEVYVPGREKEVRKRVIERNPGPMTDVAVQSVYREIMSAALALEKSLKVAFLGPPATFTHQAARSRFGGSVEYHSCETIDDVFDAVQKDQADYGVVPVENSTEGAVNLTLDRLRETTLKVTCRSPCACWRVVRETALKAFTPNWKSLASAAPGCSGKCPASSAN